MRTLNLLLAAIVISAAPFLAEAQTSGQPVKLEKNISFEDMLIKGKYQFKDETVMTVEQDKVLDGLLGVRKDFKDKIKRSASRN